ncbi:DUF533 domain-containing protein [Dokdonella sp.]|uniref:DUF533 domain-containing protein n=1 Tax=Dokdonella sp. TaxID=2291710 RepID=UPI003C635552
MHQSEQTAIMSLCLMAAYADSSKHERERDKIREIADTLGAQANLSSAVQSGADMDGLVQALGSQEARKSAYEMAVCVCDADGVQSAAEREFLEKLRDALALDANLVVAHVREADALAATPLDDAVQTGASSMTRAEQDKIILDAAILNGALELLPEALATMAIIPLQMKLVYRIGKSYGFELDSGHVKDFLATAGVGLTSQFLEQTGRRLLGGVLGAIGGRLLGGIGRQAVSSGMSFTSTYALGHLARRYYEAGRQLDAKTLRETYLGLLADAKGMLGRNETEIQAKARSFDVGGLVRLVRES